MESNTIGKILVAFLAGALLALAGSILYSRQTTILDPVHASEVPAGVIQTALAPSEPPKPITAPEPEREPPKPETSAPAETKMPVPVKSPKTAVARSPKSQDPVQEARLQANLPGLTASTEAAAGIPPVVRHAIQENPSTPVADSTEAPQTRLAIRSPDPPATQQAHVVTLPVGTNLTVRLRENLSSDRNGSGDAFQGSLDAPVITDGFIIADRQSRVVGRVIQANSAGRVKGVSNLTLALSEINTTDGQRIPVETDSYEKWGNSSVKGDAAKVAGAAALGAIIGAIAGGGKGAAIGAGAGGAAGTGVALGTRGASASIPSESIISFRLARPVTITEKFN